MSEPTASREYTDLTPLFAPRSVALVGASDQGERFGTRVFRQLINFGFQGPIYPVNPRARELLGRTCYPSIAELPQTPDHVGIVVATERVFDVLEECAARGVPFATVYSGGFAETGTAEGRERQAQLIAFARRTGMRIMGPNCNGVINFVDAFAMASTGAIGGPRRPAGNIGVVSHSGGLGQINVMWRAQEIGLGISYEASIGNEADLDSIDFARFMLRSPATDVVLMAIEGVKDGAKLIGLAREAAEREKPIVVLKFGRTAAGSRAAASHTGTIAGADDIFDAAFRQFGLIRVAETNELYEMAILLRTRRWPKGRRAASAAATGGNIVQLADVGETLGIEWPEYGASTQAKLAELMPGYGKVSNPTDMTSLATGEPENFRRALTAIADDPAIDVVTPIFAFVKREDIERGAELVRQCAKPAAMLWVGGCNDDRAFSAKDLIEAGTPVYRNALPCLRAVRAAADFGALVTEFKAGLREPERPARADASAARALLARAGKRLTEREAKAMLAAYGFTTTREMLARDAEEAIAHARALGSTVAIKIDSPDIAHKTEAGAIRLGVHGDAAVRQAFDAVTQSAQQFAPAAAINGVLVQEMAAKGIETMLGIVRDPVFGPVVAAGLGGIHVEVLRDIAYRIAPVTADEARRMLRELRGYKLLEGVRGAPPADIEALVEAIVRLSWFAHDLGGEIAELDINPLLVFERGAGVKVVDALIVRRDG
ncbi:MAG: acetate--CoA ligase family protein [Burkholderiales bacterium]